MKSDWKKVKLKDIAYLVSEKVEVSLLKGSNYISTDNMLQDKLGVEVASKLPSSKKVNSFSKGDILFSNIRPYFKKVWFSEFDGGCSADVLVWKPIDENFLTKEFLYYILSSDQFIDYSVRTSKGVKMPRGDKDAMLDYDVLLPPLEEQVKIGIFGRQIDAKISNNFLMNNTIEKILLKVFKSWFIDFDLVLANEKGEYFEGISADTQALFPNEILQTALGEIPKGWSMEKLSELIECNPTRSIKKGVMAPFVEMKALSTSGMSINYSYLREFTSGTKFVNGDTLLARITPCLENGKTAYVHGLEGVCWGSTEFIVMHSKNSYSREFIYCLARTEKFREYAIRHMTGSSGRQRVDPDVVDNYILPIPPKTILSAYSKLANPMFEKIHSNIEQNRTLAKIRDNIIPKLLSGKLTIP